MKQLLEDIKTGQFRQAYLLYGQEAYLRNQYRDRLKAAMVQEGDTMNFSSFQGKDINPAQIIDLAETMPFFADRRVILIQDSGWFKKGGEALADYLKTPSPTTFFIFAEAEADKRNRLFKAVKEAGCAVEFSTQDETTLKRWILGRIKKENKAISRSGLDFFLQKTGSDMENIDRELEKLFCYTLKKRRDHRGGHRCGLHPADDREDLRHDRGRRGRKTEGGAAALLRSAGPEGAAHADSFFDRQTVQPSGSGEGASRKGV